MTRPEEEIECEEDRHREERNTFHEQYTQGRLPKSSLPPPSQKKQSADHYTEYQQDASEQLHEMYVVTKVDPPYEFAPIFYTVLIGLYAPFCYYFFRAMHTLGYPLPWIVLTLMVTSTPILGLLPMGYMDRKIADAWDKADDAHQKYRQRVSADDKEQDNESG